MTAFGVKALFRTIVLYGTPAGFVAIGAIILGLQSGSAAASSEWFGYLSMLVALSLVLVGVKRYRDSELGGVITFAKALLVGLSISVAAGLVYALIWELYISISGTNYLEPYLTSILDSKVASGVSGVELEALKEQLDAMRAQYNNPLNRLFITFLEIFPVAVLMSLATAGLVRNSAFLPAKQPLSHKQR